MIIDFAPVASKQIKMLEFSERFAVADLRNATNAYLNTLLDIIKPFNDAQLTYIPRDPKANDPYAVGGEENTPWSLAHLVLHVTASLEEGAAFASLLARGVELPLGIRFRCEPDWKTVNHRAQVVQRIEESRRMCLALLDTWPDSPHLNVLRPLSERFLEIFGPLNAPASYLLGLSHFDGHLAQLRETASQAAELPIA